VAGPYALSGSGIQSIAQPSALVVTVTTTPILSRNGRANPPNLYDIALLTPGDDSSWYSSVPVNVSPMHLVLPAGCTRLGFSCLFGATLSVAELQVPFPNWQKSPWDRNPVPFNIGGGLEVYASAAATVEWTYTVPANTLLLLTNWTMQVVNRQVASAMDFLFIYGTINGGIIGNVTLAKTGKGEFELNQLVGAGLILPTGTQLQGAHQLFGFTGDALIYNNAIGYTFDA